MKITLPFLFLALFACAACGQDDEQEAPFERIAYPYPPEGWIENDLTTVNDCQLSECDQDRVVRYLADNMFGRIYSDENGNYLVSYTAPIDNSLNLYFCDLPEEFQEEKLDVSFDGELLDACGIYDVVFGGQNNLFVRLTRIERR